ncbi:MAG: methionine adenosyltransferase [Gammaproteobacteria bacterium]|nr:methionine adenosyltransferase [Gammaproteobacteria bacterium]
MADNYIFVSESVTEGHPDKLCDQVSDALVDEYLRHDHAARADVECAIANGVVFIGAHYHSDAEVDVAAAARRVIAAAGYEEGEFNAADCTILTSLNKVSYQPRLPELPEAPDDEWLDQYVAQHQATVFGYACRQTPELMPVPIQLAHRLARRLDEVRRSADLPYLQPDAKTQVAVEFADRQPVRIDTVAVVASADAEQVASREAMTGDLIDAVIRPAFSNGGIGLDDDTRFLINYDGLIRAGGPAMHSGLTGRKNAVDCYGEFARHSGSALSGKDAMRIDRIGAYAARYAAKNVVAAGLADECEVQLSYSIGLARPVSVQVVTFGTGQVSPGKIRKRLLRYFDFRPAGILHNFGLRSFQPLAVYGQVGRTDLDLPWERTDKAEVLQ